MRRSRAAHSLYTVRFEHLGLDWDLETRVDVRLVNLDVRGCAGGGVGCLGTLGCCFGGSFAPTAFGSACNFDSLGRGRGLEGDRLKSTTLGQLRLELKPGALSSQSSKADNRR